jgi:uncharacterized protein HemX
MSTRLTWPAVGLIAVLGAIAVALAVLTDWGSGEILGLVGVLAGIGGGAAVAGTVAGRVDQVHAETAAQSETLARIDHQTNGQSSAERQDIADRAAAAAIEAARQRGLFR